MKKSLVVISVFAGLVALYSGMLYSRLDARDQIVTAEWERVDAGYQARFDLIPALIDASRTVMPQEQPIFDSLSDARMNYDNAVTSDGKASSAGDVEAALGRLTVTLEKYPDIESSDAVQGALTQLQGKEGQIILEQKAYDDDVATYNAFIGVFPMSLAAQAFGFGQRTKFHIVAVSVESPSSSSTASTTPNQQAASSTPAVH